MEQAEAGIHDNYPAVRVNSPGHFPRSHRWSTIPGKHVPAPVITDATRRTQAISSLQIKPQVMMGILFGMCTLC